MLQFIEDFVIGFVSELEARQPGIQNQIVAVIGGSLGGNMTLRLAERNPSWLRNVVSWSAVSTYASWDRASIDPTHFGAQQPGRFFDIIKHEAVRQSRDRMNITEDTDSRHNFFYTTGGQFGHGPEADVLEFFDRGFLAAQSDHWYSSKFECRAAAVEASLQYSEEVYHPRFRRWHWRVGHEQLIFSHWDSDERSAPPHGDPSVVGTPRYKKIRTRLLFAAGKDDDLKPEMLYTNISKLNKEITMVQGEARFYANTGHSIHAERPSGFAWDIINFLYQIQQPQSQNNNSGNLPVTPKPLCPSGKKCCEKSGDGKSCVPGGCIPQNGLCR